MWRALASFIMGPFISLFNTLLNYRNVKAMIEAGVLKDVIQSDVALNQLKLQMAVINQQWWATRWIVPTIAYPTIVHYVAVILVSMYNPYGWVIYALPHPLDAWEGDIILSFFVVGTAERLVVQWLNRGIVQSLVTNIHSLFSK